MQNFFNFPFRTKWNEDHDLAVVAAAEADPDLALEADPEVDLAVVQGPARVQDLVRVAARMADQRVDQSRDPSLDLDRNQDLSLDHQGIYELLSLLNLWNLFWLHFCDWLILFRGKF